MERRHIARALELRADADKPKTVIGYAAVFYDGAQAGTEYVMGEWDGRRVVERIMPGAFDGVLSDDCRCLFDHESDKLLGRTVAKTLRLSVDATGLRYEVDLPDTSLARDIASLLSRGDLTGSSFGFTLAENGAHWLTTAGEDIRVITRVGRLYDVGPVTYPAYEGATAGLRSGGDDAELRASLAAHREKMAAEADKVRAVVESRQRRARAVSLGL